MAYEWIASPNFQPGRTAALKYILIHHWDNPAKKPSVQGVINHFKDPGIEVAAHYVVTGDRIIQMVKESDTAWHARQANPYTIGIEVDPNTPGNTYATVARLVREIRQRNGDLPLRRHSDFNQTDCPGELDLPRIDREAHLSQEEEDMKLNQGQVMRLYQLLRGNEGDAGGVKFYTGMELDDVQHQMINSDEYRDRVLIPRSEYEKLKKTSGTGTGATAKQVAAEKVVDALKEALK
jgi:hypothetical protein